MAPLFDFDCPQGHTSERLVPFWVDEQKCECGAVMSKRSVAKMNFSMPFKRGERVANYVEAAQEVEYRASLTDNPEVQAIASAVRPAYYRGQARVWAEGSNTTWNPNTDRDEKTYRRTGKKS